MSSMSRRTFLRTSSAGAAALLPLQQSKPQDSRKKGAPKTSVTGPVRYATQRCAIEWGYSSGKSYRDPFHEIELDVIFTDPDNKEQRVPAFWAGGQEWRVRYAAGVPGRYAYRTLASDPTNSELHDQRGVLEVAPYAGNNPLLQHGSIRVAQNRRHLEHEDGTPFFWLGDTWWMGLCQRLRWPEDFQLMVADRTNKGFSVIQIIAGLYPDMPPFDPRGANEAGFPWEPEFKRVNPAYFDMADLRIQHLVAQGLVPCVVGCWGYFLPLMGADRMRKHWRYLIARWGAYPVVWCLAGEGSMPYYLSQQKEEDARLQRQGWTEVGRYVHQTDPYAHLVTIHPSRSARDTVNDPSVLDFDMLQTGHSDRASIPNTINAVTGSLQQQPRMPVINGEVCYEGIMEASRQEIQRFMFWTCVLSGAAGHTYGANGIWQVNTTEKPFGPSPHGRSWGDVPWQEAYRLPGSRQLGLGKALLTRYPWWMLEPHPEWIDPHWTKENFVQPYAAGIAGKLRIAFLPPMWNPPMVKELEAGVTYRAFFFNPVNGKEQAIGSISGNAAGEWQVPIPPVFQDWVLVMENNVR